MKLIAIIAISMGLLVCLSNTSAFARINAGNGTPAPSDGTDQPTTTTTTQATATAPDYGPVLQGIQSSIDELVGTTKELLSLRQMAGNEQKPEVRQQVVAAVQARRQKAAVIIRAAGNVPVTVTDENILEIYSRCFKGAPDKWAERDVIEALTMRPTGQRLYGPHPGTGVCDDYWKTLVTAQQLAAGLNRVAQELHVRMDKLEARTKNLEDGQAKIIQENKRQQGEINRTWAHIPWLWLVAGLALLLALISLLRSRNGNGGGGVFGRLMPNGGCIPFIDRGKATW